MYCSEFENKDINFIIGDNNHYVKSFVLAMVEDDNM